MVLIAAIIVFTLFSYFIITYPIITTLDRLIIFNIQNTLNSSQWFPALFDCKIYASMIIIPIIMAIIYFIKKRMYFDIVFISTVPLITYLTGHILKNFIQRPRPPYELQLSVHPNSFSYVSSHTFISFCLWGMIVYYTHKYCENKIIKYCVYSISLIWIFLIGFSRIWLGVHHPTDIIGAYLLGIILLAIFIKIRNFVKKYIGI